MAQTPESADCDATAGHGLPQALGLRRRHPESLCVALVRGSYRFPFRGQILGLSFFRRPDRFKCVLHYAAVRADVGAEIGRQTK